MAETVKQVIPTGEWLNLSDIVGLNARVTNSGNSVLIYVYSTLQPDGESTDGHRLNEDNDFDYEIAELATESIWITSLNKNGIVSATPDLAVGTLRGALNVHDDDSHREVFNQFLHFDTATATTLADPVSAGGNQINLTSAVGFAIGNEIKISNGKQEPLFFNVMALAGTLATLDTPITFDNEAGTDVTKIHTNLAEAGLTVGATLANPVIFTSHTVPGQIIHIVGMSVVMTDTSAMDFTTFGGVAALINGLVLRAKSDGFTGSFTNWKRNFDESKKEDFSK